ncbi:site-specific integrase [Vibrio alginolyticus]|uniref:site-specific integrase n=1 Tax=Vibrio alginolyticus TaxID=663 RepID=UPI000E0622D2|nr:site-specific integrase [Vibrio alginolyticus]SUP14844.1 site-specific recombinase, phage integrase family domain protein [Vibrio alginolyticus]
MNLHDDLGFLNNIFESGVERFKKHPYLKSEFIENIWRFDTSTSTGKFVTEVDFNITLPNGELLTSESHGSLLNTFKMWIIAYLSTNSSGKLIVKPSPITTRDKLPYICKIIDYFILRDGYIKISEYGLRILSEDDVIQLFSILSSSKDTYETIYNFKDRALSYIYFNAVNSIRNNSADRSDISYDLLTGKNSYAFDLIDSKYVDNLSIMRSWLLSNDFFREDTKTSADYKYVLKVSKLGRELLGSKTIWGGKISKSGDWVEAFHLVDKSPYHIEYRRINVQDTPEDELISKTAFINFRSAWQSLKLLSSHDFRKNGIYVPEDNIIDCVDFSRVKVKNSGRFKSIPFPIVFNMIEKCIDFHLNYGEELVSSYDSVVRLVASRDYDKALSKSSSEDRTRLREFISDREFITCIHPKIKELGCNQFGRGQRWTAKELRENKSLIDLISVYFGLVAIIFGALAARRVGEYLSIKHGSAFDKKNRYVIFDREKATQNLGGLRDKIARPMDELCISMLENLERIQKVLIDCGYLSSIPHIFSYPYINPVRISEANFYNSLYQAMDKACDYFETEVVDGLRYYLRPHQLRRFFVQLYVWSSGESQQGLDVLRWFLGQTDIEHLHRYITESVTCEVLRDVEVQYVSEHIDSFPKLKSYICQKYNVNNVELLDSEELEDYINYQASKGSIIFDYEFITDFEGKKHKLLVKIVGENDE